MAIESRTQLYKLLVLAVCDLGFIHKKCRDSNLFGLRYLRKGNILVGLPHQERPCRNINHPITVLRP